MDSGYLEFYFGGIYQAAGSMEYPPEKQFYILHKKIFFMFQQEIAGNIPDHPPNTGVTVKVL